MGHRVPEQRKGRGEHPYGRGVLHERSGFGKPSASCRRRCPARPACRRGSSSSARSSRNPRRCSCASASEPLQPVHDLPDVRRQAPQLQQRKPADDHLQRVHHRVLVVDQPLQPALDLVEDPAQVLDDLLRIRVGKVGEHIADGLAQLLHRRLSFRGGDILVKLLHQPRQRFHQGRQALRQRGKECHLEGLELAAQLLVLVVHLLELLQVLLADHAPAGVHFLVLFPPGFKQRDQFVPAPAEQLLGVNLLLFRVGELHQRLAGVPEGVFPPCFLRVVAFAEQRGKRAHHALVRAADALPQLLLRGHDGVHAGVHQVGRLFHPLQLFVAQPVIRRPGVQVVGPAARAQHFPGDRLADLQRLLRRLLQRVGDLSDSAGYVLPADPLPDVLQGRVQVVRADGGVLAGGAHVLQLRTHPHQVGRSLIYVRLHRLEGRAGLLHAVPSHGVQGGLGLLHHLRLLRDLVLQDLRLVLQVQFRVAGALQLLLVQLQRLVEGLDGLLAFLHPLLELLDAGNPHLDVNARCHPLTPS